MNSQSFSKIKNITPLFLVTDVNRSLKFYTEQLGFQQSFFYEDFYCGIERDGHSIHLKSATPAKEERENRKNNEHADIIISVNNIEDWYKKIKNISVTICQPLREMPYGKEFYISDPDGYILAFIEEKKMTEGIR